MKAAKQTKTDCPITKTVELLSDSWTMFIMRALTEGPKRFTELEHWLQGISTRTLTLKLKDLKAKGLLAKSEDGIYSATEKGKGLKIIEQAMQRYSEKYL